MGSGCKETIAGKRACLQIFSSDCIIYQGESIPILGICCGDTVTEVELSIIERLLLIINGTGINLGSISLENCRFLQDILQEKDKTLLNLIQMLVDADCTLKKLIEDIQKQIAPSGDNYQFDFKCVPKPTSITRVDDVVQALINYACILNEKIKEIDSRGGSINDAIGNFIGTAVTSCGGNGIKRSGTGKDTRLSITGMPPPGTPLPYVGTLAIFDNTGKGLESTPACGWYICNGQNGTIDMRGWTFGGATDGVPGSGVLDPVVDPDALGDPDARTRVGDRKGAVKAKLTVLHLPDHTHEVIDPGHAHPYTEPELFANADKGGVPDYIAIKAGTTGATKTGISLAKTGTNQPHENRPPTKYGVWIVRLD